VEPTSSRNRLLHAAKRLFAEQGYEHTATSAIARDAGTSESQLMRYFGGKVGLLDALFEEAWTDLNSHVNEAVAAAESSREAIIEALQTVTAALARDARGSATREGCPWRTTTRSTCTAYQPTGASR